MSSDLLCASKPISFVTLVEDEEEKTSTITLFDKSKKKAGELVVSTQFIFVRPDPEPNPQLTRNCSLCVTF
jgi:hypothetical protein